MTMNYHDTLKLHLKNQTLFRVAKRKEIYLLKEQELMLVRNWLQLASARALWLARELVAIMEHLNKDAHLIKRN